MSLLELVNRFLKKRPVVFCNANDIHMLRDGTQGEEGFDKIGHSHETSKIPISDYMSYDEMKLSALLSVSSKSFFINDGNRCNQGNPDPSEKFQSDGIIVGMVGARLHRKGVMEWQDCIVEENQNTIKNGYGTNPPDKKWLVKEWGLLWNPEEPLPIWDNSNNDNFIPIRYKSSNLKFNCEIFKARTFMNAEMLLKEASCRAAASGHKAYIHVVGLGLGVWQICKEQVQLFVDAWGDALATTNTENVSHVDFSWIPATTCYGASDGEKFPNTDVILHFSKRALHAPVPSGTLLVDSFAWDSNSFPGNEYWFGSLSSSGDPAAACSSQVAELHNSLINPAISAENLHIISKVGVEHISDYVKRVLEPM